MTHVSSKETIWTPSSIGAWGMYTSPSARTISSASDIIKKAMIDVNTWLDTEPRIQMIMQVHDELVFEVHETVVDIAKQMIPSLMEKTVMLTVPIKASVGVGSNWDEAH